MCLPVLNLLNFELPPASACKFVLTSPRSLKACRRAGVKPVELLYRSLSDVESEIEDKEEARIFYEAYEMERQRKLAVCRKLRNELLLNGYWIWNDSPSKIDRHKRFSPKLQEDKDKILPFIPVVVNFILYEKKKWLEDQTSAVILEEWRKSYLLKRADTPENMKKLKDCPESPRTPMSLPKVNVVFDENTEGRLERKDQEQERKKNNFSSPQRIRIKKTEPTASPLFNHKNEEEKTPEPTESEESNFGNGNLQSPLLSDLQLHPNPHVEDQDIKREKEETSNKNIFPLSPKYTETEDINNNSIKIPKKKRPNSSTKRKSSDKKKHSKIMDHKKAFHNMLIQYSDPEYCIYKYKQVIENSVERDLRELDVQRTMRELDAGLERWQDRVLLLQWLDAARASEQVSREIEMKVERLQQKNRSKAIIHTMNINRVREAEDMKAEELRRQVEDKKRKILSLQQEKERIINESKSRALSIQELKEQIRSIEAPETFDQKVAKMSLHRKVLNSQMCPRVMHRSHIWLG